MLSVYQIYDHLSWGQDSIDEVQGSTAQTLKYCVFIWVRSSLTASWHNHSKWDNIFPLFIYRDKVVWGNKLWEQNANWTLGHSNIPAIKLKLSTSQSWPFFGGGMVKCFLFIQKQKKSHSKQPDIFSPSYLYGNVYLWLDEEILQPGHCHHESISKFRLICTNKRFPEWKSYKMIEVQPKFFFFFWFCSP